MSAPLTGRRILVTRSRQQAGGLADALQALGAQVLRLPTIEFLPPESYAHFDSLLENAASFQWLIVTSANGVSALADRLQVLHIPRHSLQHLQIIAIGPATAAALTRMGLTVAAMPEEYVAEGLVTMLKDRVAGQRILLARAAVGRDVIPEELRKCGADIHVAETYRTVVPAASVEEVQRLFQEGATLPDAVTFTSSSTVDNFFTLLAAAGLQVPHGLCAISIGPVTSQTLRRHRWEPGAQATNYNIPGLVDACVKLLTPAGWLRTGARGE